MHFPQAGLLPLYDVTCQTYSVMQVFATLLVHRHLTYDRSCMIREALATTTFADRRQTKDKVYYRQGMPLRADSLTKVTPQGYEDLALVWHTLSRPVPENIS
jgi:hypothetical protein